MLRVHPGALEKLHLRLVPFRCGTGPEWYQRPFFGSSLRE